MTDNEPYAADALDSIRTTQSALADRVSRGGWLYDTAYSVLVAVMVGSMALPQPTSWIAFSVAMLLLVVLMRVWSNHYGVSLSGISPRRARWVAWGMAPVYVGLMLVNLIGADKGWGVWVPIVTTAAGLVAAFAGSRLWRVVYRRENGLQP